MSRAIHLGQGVIEAMLPDRRRIASDVELDHLRVEFGGAHGRDADCLNLFHHQSAVHHETGGALVPIEEERLQRAEQEKCRCRLERIRDVLLQREPASPAAHGAVSCWSCGRRRARSGW
jgi:hypothetical protein